MIPLYNGNHCCSSVTNDKNGKEASQETEGKSSLDALGKVNRIKEIRRREKDGLKITNNSIM